MPEPPKPLSFQLPGAKRVEAFLVTLDDGRQVARTREELTRDPRPAAAPRTPGATS